METCTVSVRDKHLNFRNIMKSICIVICCLLVTFISNGQEKNAAISKLNPTLKVQKVKTACGQCMFGMAGKGCTLAVRIKNKTYFVEGTDINDHGDAHSNVGFCNKVRNAEVQGEIIDKKYRVTYFKLIDLEAASQ